MNLKELDSFKLSDAISLHSKLNPALFDSDGVMWRDVSDALLTIADDFVNGCHAIEEINYKYSTQAHPQTASSRKNQTEFHTLSKFWRTHPTPDYLWPHYLR